MPGPDPPLLFHGHAIEAALCDLGGENVAADMGDMGYDRSAFGIKQARDDTGHRLAEGDAQQVGGGDIGPNDSDDLVARQVRQAGMIARQLRIKLRFVGTLGQHVKIVLRQPQIGQQIGLRLGIMVLAHMKLRRFHPRQVAAKIGKRQRIVGGRARLDLLGLRDDKDAQSECAFDQARTAQNPQGLTDGPIPVWDWATKDAQIPAGGRVYFDSQPGCSLCG